MRSARSRGSTLQLVTSNPDLLSSHTNGVQTGPPRRRRHQHAFINQLAHWKQWLFNSTKRNRSPNKRASKYAPDLLAKPAGSSRPGTKEPSPRPATAKGPAPSKPTLQPVVQAQPPTNLQTSTPNKRHSLSPSPLTPRSGFRRSSTGLRGRKSTSSSVSSVRSIHHHHHTHSKASSTSSNGSESLSKVSLPTRSPHHSVKVLPATPTTSAFPSNIRVVRQAPISSFNEGVWGNSHHGFGPNASGGLVFAKRKKNLFKGPMLNTLVTSSPTSPSGAGAAHGRAGSHSRSTSVGGTRRSGEIIQEEDEDEVEEVEAFSPIAAGEEVEETVFPVSQATTAVQEEEA